MTDEQKKKLADAYVNYCWREYGEYPYDRNKEYPESCIHEGGVLPVCFTTYEFDEDSKYTHEIQINFNLRTMCWENYIDDELILSQPRDLETLIAELNGCGFDDIIRDCVHEGYRLEEEGHFEEMKKEFAV